MDPQAEDNWRRALLRFRSEKDEFFRAGAESPLSQGESSKFRGLKYFEPDAACRIEAELNRYSDPEGVVMTTSKGTRQLFNRVGYFELSLGGEKIRLSAYQSAEREDSSLFIPFRDATSGKETYGAARYLDLEVEHDDRYAVDFNYSYNPYCAYSDGYICPLPPAENWLKVPVRAGELKYHDGA